MALSLSPKNNSPEKNNYKKDIAMFSRAGKLTSSQYLVFSSPREPQIENQEMFDENDVLSLYSKKDDKEQNILNFNCKKAKLGRKQKKKQNKKCCDAVFKSISRDKWSKIFEPKIEKHSFCSYKVIEKQNTNIILDKLKEDQRDMEKQSK